MSGIDVRRTESGVDLFIETREKICSFCLKPPEHVAQMFMGPGAEGEPGTPFVCNRCVAAFSDALDEMKVAHDPNEYCRVCRFEIYGSKKRVLAGYVHAACAYELALWCLGVRSLPFFMKDWSQAYPETWRFKLFIRLNTPKRNRTLFLLVLILLALASFSLGRLSD